MTDKWVKRLLWAWGGVVLGTITAMVIALNNREDVLANTYSMMANVYFGLLIAFIVVRKIYLAFRPKRHDVARVLAYPEEYTMVDMPTNK